MSNDSEPKGLVAVIAGIPLPRALVFIGVALVILSLVTFGGPIEIDVFEGSRPILAGIGGALVAAGILLYIKPDPPWWVWLLPLATGVLVFLAVQSQQPPPPSPTPTDIPPPTETLMPTDTPTPPSATVPPDTPVPTNTPTTTPTTTQPASGSRTVEGTFTANVTSVNAGDNVTLTWDLHANQPFTFSVVLVELTISGIQIQTLAATTVEDITDSTIVRPQETTTYRLDISYDDENGNPTLQQKELTVTVV